jgi:hypothetical protein
MATLLRQPSLLQRKHGLLPQAGSQGSNNLLLNKNEQINHENCADYMKFLKYIMSHLGEWKADQMKQRAACNADWERQSVDPVTWHNLRRRRGVVAFLHFTTFMLAEIPGLKYVPVLAITSSCLERKFSEVRATKMDAAHKIGKF